MNKLLKKFFAWLRGQSAPPVQQPAPPPPIVTAPPSNAGKDTLPIIADDVDLANIHIAIRGCHWPQFAPTKQLTNVKRYGRDKITWQPKLCLWPMGTGLIGDICCLGWLQDGELRGGKFDWDVRQVGQKDFNNVVYVSPEEPGMGIPDGATVYFWKQSNSTKSGSGERTALVDVGAW